MQEDPQPVVDTVNANYGSYPDEYEARIKNWSEANLKDPESVRYGRISRPREEYIFENHQPVFGYTVCASINAKNSYGGYTGQQIFWFFFRDGQIRRSQSAEGFPGMAISRWHKVNCDDGPELKQSPPVPQESSTQQSAPTVDAVAPPSGP